MDSTDVVSSLALVVTFLPVLGATALLLASAVRNGAVELGPRAASLLHGTALALAWTPTLFLVGLTCIVAKAWIDVGAPPSLPGPDSTIVPLGRYSGGPHPGEYEPVRSILIVIGAANLCSILAAPGVFSLARAAERPAGTRTVRAYYATWILTVLLLIVDPGGLATWAFAD